MKTTEKLVKNLELYVLSFYGWTYIWTYGKLQKKELEIKANFNRMKEEPPKISIELIEWIII
jgi:hypothetical protein